MQPYQGVDFYRFDESLSDDERNVQKMVRTFVARRFLPLIKEHHAAGTFPTELIPELAELGFLGSSIAGHGCPGLSHTIYGIICQELERGDSGLRSFVSVQGSLVMWPIATYGSEEQKERFLPGLAAGELVGAFGLTEAGHGSDPGSMETSAVKDGDDWILSGAKMWITNASLADVAVVWAKGSLDGGPPKVLGFLVERGMDGFSTQRISGKFSLRASDTGELVFDAVRVPEANRLPEARGLWAPLMCLNEARFGIAWGAVGAASDCFHVAREYARERKQFGKPIAGFQMVQEKLVGMLTEIVKAQGLALQLGRLKDRGVNEVPLVSLAKRNNVAMALDCARTARAVLGAAGITGEPSPGRHMNNLESVYTYEGTHDIHTLIVGHEITGISAYR